MQQAISAYRGHRQRLKKKFFDAGLQAFHDYEVLELLLSYAISRKDVKPLAKELLTRFGSLKNIVDAEIEDISKVSGIGMHAAVLLKLIKEMGNLYLGQKAKEKEQITCTEELLNYCKTTMGGLKDERFCVIYLDARNKIINVNTVQEGIVNQAVVYPRKVMEKALKNKASAIILVHNHPSGYVQPSEADIKLTKAIHETAKILDIVVHDHVIVGENRFFSFRQEGIMPL
jgi:DNA repair protein RadC